MADDAVRLVLEDGTTLAGRGFGASRAVAGEVVFNTAMVGYVEALTDPSYRGQILMLTYPLIGNYGVPAPRPAGSIDRPFEADRIQVQGLAVQNYAAAYSHASATRSLGDWLAAEGVPAIEGIDTRTLTRKLREFGTMKGWLLPGRRRGERGRGGRHGGHPRSGRPVRHPALRRRRTDDPPGRCRRQGQHRALRC